MRSRGARVFVVLAAAVVIAPVTVAATTQAQQSPCPSIGSQSMAPAPASTETTEFDGTTRRYRLALPATDAGVGVPVILNLHGFGSEDVLQAVYSQLETKGPARGYAVITPQGSGDPAAWNTRGSDGPDDAAFMRALVDTVASRVCIDRSQVFATGFSLGAKLAVALACDPRTELVAIAPVGGVNLYGHCPRGRPVSVIAFHGRADEDALYDGGRGIDASRPKFVVPSVTRVIRSWARRDNCSEEPARTRFTAHVQRTRFRGCEDGTAVVLYTVADGGHTWPGSIEVPGMGHVTQEINAADLMLDFFDDQGGHR